jgi:hypothetical protein
MCRSSPSCCHSPACSVQYMHGAPPVCTLVSLERTLFNHLAINRRDRVWPSLHSMQNVTTGRNGRGAQIGSHLGTNCEANFMSCDFPVPGSPTQSMWMSPRTRVASCSTGTPPTSISRRASLASNAPQRDGQKLRTRWFRAAMGLDACADQKASKRASGRVEDGRNLSALQRWTWQAEMTRRIAGRLPTCRRETVIRIISATDVSTLYLGLRYHA